ncbi:MAG: hypothetical protein R2727_03225 [Bacteroidales bacterium]
MIFPAVPSGSDPGARRLQSGGYNLWRRTGISLAYASLLRLQGYNNVYS